MKLLTIAALAVFATMASAGAEVFTEVTEKITASFNQETGTFTDGAHETLLEAYSMIAAADLTDVHELIALDALNSVVTYNLACLESLSGNNEEALVWLEKAVASGYADSEWMLQDEDLSALKDDPKFIELVSGADENTLETAHDCSTCQSRGNCEATE